MSERDTAMEKEIVRQLLRELNTDGIEVHADHFEISKTAEADILEGLYTRISGIMHPSLFRMFLQSLNEQDVLDDYLLNDNSKEHDSYRRSFAHSIHASELQEKLPALISLVKRSCVQYQTAVSEMLARIDASFEDICRNLLAGNPFHALTHISTDSGDVHNRGRTTSVISTDKGRFVYKPHDVGIDRTSFELIGRFFSDVLKAPAVCDCGGYGFTEFIVNTPAETDEDARIYFHHLGGLTAVVLMMGSSDLHHNNVLSSGVYPVIIDYELMMTPGTDVKEHTIAHDLRYSLYYSSLMPQRRDDIEMSILFAKDDKYAGAPVVNGERKNICDYPEEFFRGFEEIYRRCMAQREELKTFIASMKDVCVRHIFRNTGSYKMLMDRTLEPAWLGDEHLEEEVYKQLSVAMERNGSKKGSEIIRAETDAILRGDIPYFYMRTDSCDLYENGRIVCTDFFHHSCIDHVRSRIDYLSEADLTFEKALLKKAMSRVVRREKKGPEKRERIIARHDISDEKLLHAAEAIFREIAEDAVYTPSGEICWFGLNYYLETGMRLYDLGFIDGMTGLAVFFSALHRITRDEEIKTKAEELLTYLRGRMDRYLDELDVMNVIYPNIENCSVGSGLAGKLFGWYLVGRYMQDESTMDRCRKFISLLKKAELDYEGMDIFSGLSGLLKVLCRYDDIYALPGVRELCSELADRIVSAADIPYEEGRIWKTTRMEWAVSGAGHGQSGIASALYAAGKRLQREDLIKAAETGFAFEKGIYSPELGAWPDRRGNERSQNYLTGYCSGAPGIGMNAVCLKYGGYEETLEKAIQSTLKEPLQYKDHLCCGNSAMIEFLILAGNELNREDLVQAARTRMAMVIRRAEKNGHYNCINRSMNNVYTSSLFYGTAGIGYEILRLLDPEKTESVLI